MGPAAGLRGRWFMSCALPGGGQQVEHRGDSPGTSPAGSLPEHMQSYECHQPEEGAAADTLEGWTAPRGPQAGRGTANRNHLELSKDKCQVLHPCNSASRDCWDGEAAPGKTSWGSGWAVSRTQATGQQGEASSTLAWAQEVMGRNYRPLHSALAKPHPDTASSFGPPVQERP